MCKGLHGLATNWNECKFSFLTQHLLPVYTFVAPAPANECAECSHVVCCDAFWFTWISLGFLSVWNQTKPWDEAASLQTHQLIQSKQAIGVKAPLESPASPTKTVCEQTPVWLINKEKAAVCVHFYVMYMILYMYLTVMMPVLFFVFFLIFQIVSAVQYCHQRRIVHRDLKVKVCETISPHDYPHQSLPVGVDSPRCALPLFLFTAGREPVVRCRYEHQDSWFRLQQWVHCGQQTGYFLWLSAIRCSRTLPGEEVRWSRGGCLESRGYPLHTGQRLTALWWTEPKGGQLFCLFVCLF